MAKKIFGLHHIHRLSADCDDRKDIGLYLTWSDLKNSYERSKPLLGFVDCPEGFLAEEYHLNQDYWINEIRPPRCNLDDEILVDTIASAASDDAPDDVSPLRDVVLLHYVHEKPNDCDDVVLIGIYATKSDAEKASVRAIDSGIFGKNAAEFEIDDHRIGRDGWCEGYVTIVS